MPNYVKIPREIIYDTSLSDKRVIIFSYLCARRSLDDTVAFSTTELCHWSNLKPNYRDGKINQKYYEVLLLLSQNGYFSEYPDFKKYLTEKSNSEKFRKIKLNIDKFDVPDNFGIIYFDELFKILNFKNELENISVDISRMSSAYLILVLSYIRVNMNRDPSKPLCCYRHYKTIHEDIGLSEKYVARCIDILTAMNIITFKAMYRKTFINTTGQKCYRTTPKVFADYKHYVKNSFGNICIDQNYNPEEEINKQIKILENLQTMT